MRGLRSALRWLWPAAPRTFAAPPSPAREAHVARARAAAAQAERALSADDADDTPEAAHAALTTALGSLREAAYEALCACAPDAPDVAAAFDLAPDVALLAAGDSANLSAVRAALAERPPALLAALDGPTLSDDVRRAGAFVHALLDALDTGPIAPLRRLARRGSRLGAVVALVVMVVVLAPMGRLALRPELAHDAPWRASTTLPDYDPWGRGFHPLEGASDIFFHTRTESSPWVSFDLGAGASIERIRVRNRPDCCQERAVPLVVECSLDEVTWREVARRNAPYFSWTATFPRTASRYVRLRVPRESVLHLAEVEMW